MRSDILLIGLGPLGAESAKNLLLAGIRRLTLLDTEVVTEADVNQSILLTKCCLGKLRGAASMEACKALNSLVNVDTLDRPVDSLREEDIAPYTVVVLTEQSQPVCSRLSKLCRKLDVHFCSLSLYGSYAFGILDFQRIDKTETSQETPATPTANREEVLSSEVLANGKIGELEIIECRTPVSEDKRKSRELRRLKNCLSAIHSVLAFEKSAGRRWSPKDAQVLAGPTGNEEFRSSPRSEVLSRLCEASVVPMPIVSGVICGEIANALSEGSLEGSTRFYFSDMSTYNGSVVPSSAVPELENLLFD